MEITNIIINVSISLVVGGGTGFAIFKWFGKRWVSLWFDKDLEKYKQQLDLLKMQKQLQYSNVYIQRAEVIKEIYRLLARITLIKQAITGTNFQDKEKEDRAYADYGWLLRELYIYATDNGVYLPQTTFAKLGSALDIISKEVILREQDLNEKLNTQAIESIKQIPDLDLSQIINELKSEFQTLLGIEEK